MLLVLSLCPKEAIKLQINYLKAIYEPEIDFNKCNLCGVCHIVCPGHEVDFNELSKEIFRISGDDLVGNYSNLYTGYSTHKDIRFNSSSGGLITQLLIYALNKGIIDGALVTNMNKDDPLFPEPFIAKTEKEIIEASKSKYCPVPLNKGLKQIIRSHNNEKFAVVGLPCHIQGIRKAERHYPKLKEKIVLHIGIVCNHAPTFFATEFLLKNQGIKLNKLKK